MRDPLGILEQQAKEIIDDGDFNPWAQEIYQGDYGKDELHEHQLNMSKRLALIKKSAEKLKKKRGEK